MKTIKQCPSCPWRKSTVPERDIPGYVLDMHRNLRRTLGSGPESIFRGNAPRYVMACHLSEPGSEFPCAGWLANQLGPGNNFGLRLAVIEARMPSPEVEGEQHHRFEDTLPKPKRRRPWER